MNYDKYKTSNYFPRGSYEDLFSSPLLGIFPPPFSPWSPQENKSTQQVFEHGVTEDNKNYRLALGIFRLKTETVNVLVTKNNVLSIIWEESGKFQQYKVTLPKDVVPSAQPTLTYEGGILTIDVPIAEKPKLADNILFSANFKES